jgi:hypothetical protein
MRAAINAAHGVVDDREEHTARTPPIITDDASFVPASTDNGAPTNGASAPKRQKLEEHDVLWLRTQVTDVVQALVDGNAKYSERTDMSKVCAPAFSPAFTRV